MEIIIINFGQHLSPFIMYFPDGLHGIQVIDTRVHPHLVQNHKTLGLHVSVQGLHLGINVARGDHVCTRGEGCTDNSSVVSVRDKRDDYNM